MNRPTRVLLIVSIAQLVSVINASSMVVVAPAAALDLNADLPTAQWFVLGAFLAIAAFLVPAGRMGDLIGRKPLYVTGFVLLLAGTILSAISDTAASLILGRLVVGTGASLLQGNSLPLLMTVFPADRRGSVIATQVSVVGLGGVLGPLAGGVLVDALGWRNLMWLFAVLALGMVLVCTLGLKRRPHRPPASWRAFDWAGAALSAMFLVTTLTALTFAPRYGWLDRRLLVVFAVAGLLLIAFIAREMTAKLPMLRLSLFRIPAIAIGATGTLALFMTASSMRFLIPFHMQFVQGYSPKVIGFVLVPAAIALVFVSPLAGRLADRLGPRRVAAAGLFFVLAAIIALSGIDAETSVVMTACAVTMVGTAMSVFHAPNGAAMINAVDEHEYGVASGVLSLSRNIGNVLGIALGTVVVTTVMSRAGVPSDLEPAALAASIDRQNAFVDGMQAAFMTFGILVVAMIVISIVAIIRQPDRAGRPRPPG